MKRKKEIYIITALLLFLLIHKPVSVAACSCVMLPAVEEGVADADAVFRGEVIAVKEKKSFQGYMTKRVHFKVNETWKGLNETEVLIATGGGGGDCGVDFTVGKEYVVYADNSDFYGDQMLTTTICTRTAELAEATEDIQVLGEGEKPSVETSLGDSGEFSQYRFLLIGGLVFLVGVLVIFGLYLWKKKKR